MRRLLQFTFIVAVCWFAEYVAKAAEIQVPQNAVAGSEVSLPASGSGTLYLFGPGTAIKKDVKSGEQMKLTLKNAGKYTAIMNGSASSFFVEPGPTNEVAFLAR